MPDCEEVQCRFGDVQVDDVATLVVVVVLVVALVLRHVSGRRGSVVRAVILLGNTVGLRGRPDDGRDAATRSRAAGSEGEGKDA